MVRRGLLSLLLLFAALPAEAQWVPKQPIHIIVGFAPGGTADIAARLAEIETEKTNLLQAMGERGGDATRVRSGPPRHSGGFKIKY